MFNETNDYHQNFLRLIFSVTDNFTFLQFGMFLARFSCIIMRELFLIPSYANYYNFNYYYSC